jgi:exodeoxyribonuclease VII small subunit
MAMKDFEQNLARLEAIQTSVKSSDITLEESLALFEEGVVLARELEKELKEAEQRIEILTNPDLKDDEEPEFTLMSQE